MCDLCQYRGRIRRFKRTAPISDKAQITTLDMLGEYCYEYCSCVYGQAEKETDKRIEYEWRRENYDKHDDPDDNVD